MEITPTIPPAIAQATPQSASVLSSDFETFLRMLTAQARYQDPLEPLDSSEYAAQLAQFSMVEQQVLSNDLLTSLSTQLGAGNLSQIAGWIGMEARSTAPVLFDGAPIPVSRITLPGADQQELVVRNASGTIVQRLAIPPGDDPLQWAGVQENGGPFPTGLYSFEVEGFANDALIDTQPLATYARVVEARLDAGQAVVVLEGGSELTVSDVTALRAP